MWVLRTWSIPVVLVLLAPSTIAFSNFILVEAIAIPVAAAGATASVALLQSERRARPLVWLGMATAAAVALPMLRLHYVAISLAIAAAILCASRSRKISQRSTLVALSTMSLTVGLLVGALALENLNENDVLFPSIGAERNMFWATWENVVVSH